MAENVHVAEIVSGTDHGGLRRLVMNAVRIAHELRGLPFVRLGVAPVTYSGTFGIRIDADDFDPVSTADRRRRAGPKQHARHLVHRRRAPHGKERWPSRHRVARGRARSAEPLLPPLHLRLRRAQSSEPLALTRRPQNVGRRHSRGRVAPFGSFNAGLRDAFDRAQIKWSSEFSAIYDDIPTFIEGRMQIPVHPICPSLILQSGLSDDAVIDYYERRLRGKPPA